VARKTDVSVRTSSHFIECFSESFLHCHWLVHLEKILQDTFYEIFAQYSELAN